jgi:Clp amino terminal domain, pathogenicity island component
MTTLDIFTPPARDAVVRAGIEAAARGQAVLGPEFLLLALAGSGPLAGRPQGLGVSPDAIRGQIQARREPTDDMLLSALGIDAAEVRRRALGATGVRLDDTALWALRRSRSRPLRVTLHGPAGSTRLSEGSRKVIEVAAWARCRRGRLTAEHGRHPLARPLLGRWPRADREDLLWGLLADGSSPAVHILAGLGADLRSLWTDLQSWQASQA